MKKLITLFAFVAFALVPACSFAQGTGWAPMKTFHNYMAATFHPAEDGDFAPLKAKVDSMYYAAKNWSAAPVPSTFKERETKEELGKLVAKISDIQYAVKNNAEDKELYTMISDAHDIFHKISGECRKDHE